MSDLGAPGTVRKKRFPAKLENTTGGATNTRTVGSAAVAGQGAKAATISAKHMKK